METNEFVIKFANVNGSGSASANGLLAKSLFKMGLPIGAKNIFPSNIQGLPTWYEIRVSAKGFVGRRGGVDLMVMMNPQSFKEDVAEVVPGGVILYDSTAPLAKDLLREDVTLFGVPITEMCAEKFSNAKDRSLLKNIVYVGALVRLLQMDRRVVDLLMQAQYGKKPNLLQANQTAFDMGFDYAAAHGPKDFGLRIEPMAEQKKDSIMVDGNTAAALGCVYAGATVAAWYPITPSTSLVDAFDRYCQKLRIDEKSGQKKFAILQAEDELCAAGVVLGASWNGARAFTATSGPGISLMSEFLGYAYYAELPAVIFNIQRVGPSTGMPTRTQQADLVACAYASHGDTKHLLLFPATPRECFDFAVAAFDLAEFFQTPVIVMSDINLGMNDWISEPFAWDDSYRPNRGKVLTRQELEDGAKFFRYLDQDGDGVCYRTYPGTHPSKGAFFTRGSGHDKFGRYTEGAADYQENLDRLTLKFQTAATKLPPPQIHRQQGAEVALVYCGTTAEAIPETLHLLAQDGIHCDTMRLRAFPFPDSVREFVEGKRSVFIIEQNRDCQLRQLLTTELGLAPQQMTPIRIYDGQPIAARVLAAKLRDAIRAMTPQAS